MQRLYHTRNGRAAPVRRIVIRTDNVNATSDTPIPSVTNITNTGTNTNITATTTATIPTSFSSPILPTANVSSVDLASVFHDFTTISVLVPSATVETTIPQFLATTTAGFAPTNTPPLSDIGTSVAIALSTYVTDSSDDASRTAQIWDVSSTDAQPTNSITSEDSSALSFIDSYSQQTSTDFLPSSIATSCADATLPFTPAPSVDSPPPHRPWHPDENGSPRGNWYPGIANMMPTPTITVIVAEPQPTIQPSAYPSTTVANNPIYTSDAQKASSGSGMAESTQGTSPKSTMDTVTSARPALSSGAVGGISVASVVCVAVLSIFLCKCFYTRRWISRQNHRQLYDSAVYTSSAESKQDPHEQRIFETDVDGGHDMLERTALPSQDDMSPSGPSPLTIVIHNPPPTTCTVFSTPTPSIRGTNRSSAGTVTTVESSDHAHSSCASHWDNDASGRTSFSARSFAMSVHPFSPSERWSFPKPPATQPGLASNKHAPSALSRSPYSGDMMLDADPFADHAAI